MSNVLSFCFRDDGGPRPGDLFFCESEGTWCRGRGWTLLLRQTDVKIRSKVLFKSSVGPPTVKSYLPPKVSRLSVQLAVQYCWSVGGGGLWVGMMGRGGVRNGDIQALFSDWSAGLSVLCGAELKPKGQKFVSLSEDEMKTQIYCVMTWFLIWSHHVKRHLGLGWGIEETVFPQLNRWFVGHVYILSEYRELVITVRARV